VLDLAFFFSTRPAFLRASFLVATGPPLARVR
jgi:hypothetical protein